MAENVHYIRTVSFGHHWNWFSSYGFGLSGQGRYNVRLSSHCDHWTHTLNRLCWWSLMFKDIRTDWLVIRRKIIVFSFRITGHYIWRRHSSLRLVDFWKSDRWSNPNLLYFFKCLNFVFKSLNTNAETVFQFQEHLIERSNAGVWILLGWWALHAFLIFEIKVVLLRKNVILINKHLTVYCIEVLARMI